MLFRLVAKLSLEPVSIVLAGIWVILLLGVIIDVSLFLILLKNGFSSAENLETLDDFLELLGQLVALASILDELEDLLLDGLKGLVAKDFFLGFRRGVP